MPVCGSVKCLGDRQDYTFEMPVKFVEVCTTLLDITNMSRGLYVWPTFMFSTHLLGLTPWHDGYLYTFLVKQEMAVERSQDTH